MHGPGDRRKTSPVRLGSSVQLLKSDSLLKTKTFWGCVCGGGDFCGEGEALGCEGRIVSLAWFPFFLRFLCDLECHGVP